MYLLEFKMQNVRAKQSSQVPCCYEGKFTTVLSGVSMTQLVSVIQGGIQVNVILFLFLKGARSRYFRQYQH